MLVVYRHTVYHWKTAVVEMQTLLLLEGLAWASCQICKIEVVHVPGMLRTFSPPPRVSDPDMHHSTCMTRVPWCMPGSLTSGFLWSWWWGKRSQHSRLTCIPQFYISGKRPIIKNIGSISHDEVGFVKTLGFQLSDKYAHRSCFFAFWYRTL